MSERRWHESEFASLLGIALLVLVCAHACNSCNKEEFRQEQERRQESAASKQGETR